MTQPLQGVSITKHKSVGYSVIFKNESEIYELSENGSVLRRTLIKCNRKQELYWKINDTERIKAIDSNKGIQKLLMTKSTQNYYIIKQFENDEETINNIRIIKKSDAELVIEWKKKTLRKKKKYIYYAGKESI